ncbi:MAG: MFS transporter [Opitutus sp.]
MTPARSAFFLLLIIYLGFISLGLPDGTLGVAWPPIHTELHLPIGLAGTVLIVATLLAASAAFLSGKIIARLGTGPVVLVSCVLTGSGLMTIAHAQSMAWLLGAAIPLGFGAGAVDAGLNGYVARHYTGRHMNWLHACWGIGATAGPIVMARALGLDAGWRGGYIFLGSVQLSLAVLFLLTLRLWQIVPERSATHGDAVTSGRPPSATANSVAGWLSAAIFALYVAVETTTGLWANSILVVSRGIDPKSAALCAAAYYGSITAGRISVGFVVERWGNRRLVTGGAILALTGATLFAFASSTPAAALALVLLGLGFAPIYPGLMHEVPRRFVPAAVQTVIGRQSGAAMLGSAILPAAAGSLAAFSLESIAWTVIAGATGLLLSIRRLDRIT